MAVVRLNAGVLSIRTMMVMPVDRDVIYLLAWLDVQYALPAVVMDVKVDVLDAQAIVQVGVQAVVMDAEALVLAGVPEIVKRLAHVPAHRVVLPVVLVAVPANVIMAVKTKK